MKQPVVAPVVALVVFNQFSSFHFSVPCIIFKDIMPEQPLFDLRVCAGEVGELKSNAGLQITPEYDVTELRSADIVIVPFWRNPAERPPQPLLDELRKPTTGVHRLWACVWELMFWLMRACFLARKLQRTGNLSLTFKSVFQM